MTSNQMSFALGSIRSFKRTEKKVRLRIEELRAGLYPSGIRYDKDKVQTSPLDQMLETLSMIDVLERNLKCLQEEIYTQTEIIRTYIQRLPYKERFVIEAYYITCFSIRDISKLMEITERHVLRLKQNGISMLCEAEDSKNA